MKLYLDDVRDPPFGWDLVKTADECIAVLATGKVLELSLDHDLAPEHYLEAFSGPQPDVPAKTGLAVVDWMIAENVWPERIILHSMNPMGRDSMRLAIERRAPDHVRLEIRVGFRKEFGE